LLLLNDNASGAGQDYLERIDYEFFNERCNMALEHKRGDSLSLMGEIPESYEDGFFVGWAVSSQIRTAQYYSLVDNLTVEWVDPLTSREFLLTKTDTSAWPVGNCVIDVQFVREDGFTKSTDTMQITVIRDVTYPEPSV